ncbi:MAG: hypothetical protein WCK42_00970 [Myxococcaceae bacterium]
MKSFTCKCLLVCFLAALRLYSSENSTTQEALNKYALIIDKNPENKIIRKSYFYIQEPFDKSDKFLSWLNHLQFETKEKALQNQLWIHPGDVYNANLLVENERALLNLLVRSFIRIFPVQKADDPSSTEVDLLIVTRDIFSWQASSAISSAGGALGQLSLGLAQTNLFGMNKTVGLNFNMNQKLINLSANYFDPSLFSTKNQLTFLQGVYLNRDGLRYEGINTSFLLTYPLATEDTPWGYTASFNYNEQPVYDFRGNEIREYGGYKRQYHALQISPQIVGVRSFGKTNKNNLSFGYGANLFRYEPLETVSESFIKQVLPYSEFQSFFVLGYAFFQNHFLALRDYNTFSMTEWQQLGPSFSLNNHIALGPILGSDHTFWNPTISVGISAAPNKDSLIIINSQFQTRLQEKAVNNQASVKLTAVFPTLFKFGRFVLSSSYAQLWDNLNNAQFTLGGSTGLRGAPYRYYLGNQYLLNNLEFRTTSLSFWILRLGLVGFYDFGAAFDNQKDFNPTHDLGLGLRILMVPWNRMLIRVDAAVPVGGAIAGFQNTLVTVGIGQAF